MIYKVEIRESRSSDLDELLNLYREAFPAEDLTVLVRDLLTLESDVLSLTCISDQSIIGHICFTFCQIENANHKVALLGPLAVTPTLQKRGIGRSLVQTGFQKLESLNTDCIFVLGDPGFYARFGFQREDNVLAPYPLPSQWSEAWQSFCFDDDTHCFGRLIVPNVWQNESLWTS